MEQLTGRIREDGAGSSEQLTGRSMEELAEIRIRDALDQGMAGKYLWSTETETDYASLVTYLAAKGSRSKPSKIEMIFEGEDRIFVFVSDQGREISWVWKDIQTEAAKVDGILPGFGCWDYLMALEARLFCWQGEILNPPGWLRAIVTEDLLTGKWVPTWKETYFTHPDKIRMGPKVDSSKVDSPKVEVPAGLGDDEALQAALDDLDKLAAKKALAGFHYSDAYQEGTHDLSDLSDLEDLLVVH